jgi:hypothetical protein
VTLRQTGVVFLLIGMREGHQDFYSALRVVFIAIVLVTLAGRPALYSFCAFFVRSNAECLSAINTFYAGAAYAVHWHWRLLWRGPAKCLNAI